MLSEEQLAVFAKPEVFDVVADTLIPLCEEGVQSWVYAHMGKAPDANIAGGEVSFKSAPKYAHLFKDIYVLLLQLLESDRENRYVRPDQTNADVFNALFGYPDM